MQIKLTNINKNGPIGHEKLTDCGMISTKYCNIVADCFHFLTIAK